MNNQEAIRLIRNLPTMCEFTDAYGEPIDSDAYYEAVDMAISALQAQDSPKPKAESVQNVQNEDLISRKAAIDAIGKASDELYEKIKKGAMFPQRQWFGGMAQAQSILENLPSAQPEPLVKESRTLVKDLVKDTISRQAAIDEIEERKNANGYRNVAVISELNRLEGYIMRLPSAQPEPQWIPISESLPEEDYWLGGSGKQFSDEVLVSIYNSDDEDEWVDVSQTIDGEWIIELPKRCEIVAWMPIPEPYRAERRTDVRA